MGKVAGFDLGSGFSAVAVVTNGKPEILENSEGKRTTASVITIDEKGERTVGDAAKRKMVTLPKNTVSFIKRFMGVDYQDADVLRKTILELSGQRSRSMIVCILQLSSLQ